MGQGVGGGGQIYDVFVQFSIFCSGLRQLRLNVFWGLGSRTER